MEYRDSENEVIGAGNTKRINWKPFLRQLFICSGPWSLYFMQGLCYGMPAVVIPQLRKDNQTIDDDAASWLPTTHTYSGIPWAIILSCLVGYIGRKKSHIIVCLCTLIGFTIYLVSTKITHILIGEIFQGALSSSYLTTCMTVLTEFVSSKYRGVFLTIKSATFFWGILVANALGTFFHWHKIAILGICCSIYTLLNVIIWPESPLWLASKNRFDECAAAHKWLKGEDVESIDELEKLLKSHKDRSIVKQKTNVRTVVATIFRKDFLKPIALANLLICLYASSGKLICTVYALDILKKITNNQSTAYTSMLILDGVTVISMYVGCFISKVLKRKFMLTLFSILSILFLILITGYLYLVKLAVLSDNKYISLLLLAGYSISSCCGPMIMSTSIIGELLTLEFRTLSMCIIALCFKLIYGTFLKISPFCFKQLAMHGTFAMYAILSIIFLTLIHIYVPETKDKTLQEIDDCIKGVDRRNEEGEVLMNGKNLVK